MTPSHFVGFQPLHIEANRPARGEFAAKLWHRSFILGQVDALATFVADGTVIAWGDNSARQCEVPADLASAVAVFAGGEGSAALDSSGAFRPWGLVPGGAAGVTGRVAQAAMGSSVWAVIESAFGDDGVLEP
jgi:hypothetical protein